MSLHLKWMLLKFALNSFKFRHAKVSYNLFRYLIPSKASICSAFRWNIMFFEKILCTTAGVKFMIHIIKKYVMAITSCKMHMIHMLRVLSLKDRQNRHSKINMAKNASFACSLCKMTLIKTFYQTLISLVPIAEVKSLK